MKEVTFQDILDNGYKYEDEGVKDLNKWLWAKRNENDDVYYPSTKIEN